MTDARVERLWSNVSERLEKPASRVWRGLLLGGALAAAAGLALWLTRPAQPVPVALGHLEASKTKAVATLRDGSSFELAAGSSLDVQQEQPTSVALVLQRGQVSFDVTHREGRKFSVVAGDVEVRVVGTAFSIKTSAGDAPRVEVSVLRGAVEVRSARRPGIVARVAAGQSWIQEQGLREALSAAPLAAPVAATPATAPERTADTPSTPAGAAPAVASTAAGVGNNVPSARELFEKAGESRRAGDAGAAAHAYEELLRLHPTDARAGLAAFELGRLRMDRLGDSAGAVSALERAVALNVGPSFREDALARLVSAYAAQGNGAACARARDRYLSSYPAGVHVSSVAARCGSR
ncbi:MAG TPA: FecR domain-containing protein [Polyangiaceae bacterium]|nr:FecR domain-containing protein [Polyangiaceae bacterium]